ncbi:protein phosphatase 2C domain-containing protein [Streptomyces hundungensis]|uniref:protein phosphatase 2C domain-containing protein n=1 Tax=Streptomyces hundungensis TaxID=1077946 RepID=UPI003410EF8A
MSQQGERPARDDDWWNRLYDESAPDAGPDGSRDSLDDRFNSVSDTVRCPTATDTPSRPAPPPAPPGAPLPPGAAQPSDAAPSPDTAPPPTAPPPPNTSPASSDAAPPPGAAPPNNPVPSPGVAPLSTAPPPPDAVPASASATPPPGATPPHDTAAAPTAPPPIGDPDATPSAPEPRPRAPWEAPEGAHAPRGAVAWWEAVPAAPPPPAEPAPLPDLPPGWAEDAALDAPNSPGTRPPTPASPGAGGEEPFAGNAPHSPTARPPAPASTRTAGEEPFAANAPRTPTLDASGPPMTAPDEQFAQPARFTSLPRPRTGHVGDGPPTYDAEPTALPAARPEELDDLVADTVLDGARYGTYVLRAVSARGDSARYRGEARRDALLTARFGTGENALVLVAVASGVRTSERAQLAAADACHWIGGAIGRSHVRLAEDIRAGRRGDLKSGLHRLTDRSYGMLRARAAELGAGPEEYTAHLRCLLLSADPACRTRVFFGVGHGGLFRLRGGVWQDIEPAVPEPGEVLGEPVVGFGSAPAETPGGDRLTMDLGTVEPARPYIDPPVPPGEPFRFRASVARPGDTLLLCSAGLAEPLRGEAALAEELAERWAAAEPPGLAAFLADVQLRVKGYADDRTAVAVWEA